MFQIVFNKINFMKHVIITLSFLLLFQVIGNAQSNRDLDRFATESIVLSNKENKVAYVYIKSLGGLVQDSLFV